MTITHDALDLTVQAPPSPHIQTDETDNITFPQLRWRAVINYQYFMFKKNNVQEWDICAILFKVILTNFIIVLYRD